MKLVDIINEKKVVNIDEIKDRELIIEVQSSLASIGLYTSAVDGVVGNLTLSALANFKSTRYLEYPKQIGASTARSLLEGKHPIPSDTLSSNSTPDLDEKTGNSMLLPTGETVWANQRIVENIPLTWGEVSKDCIRVPYKREHVGNLVRTARGFGDIRSKYNKAIGITSGIRPNKPRDFNKEAGGVSNSQHIYGLALDLQPLDGDFARLLRVIRNSDVTGIGLGQDKGFIHVDWRGGDRTVFSYG